MYLWCLRRHLPIIGPMLFGLARFSAPECLKQDTTISPVHSDSTLSHVSSTADTHWSLCLHLNLFFQVYGNSLFWLQCPPCLCPVCLLCHWKSGNFSKAQKVKNSPEWAELKRELVKRQQAHSHTGGNWVSACFKSHSHHSPIERQ